MATNSDRTPSVPPAVPDVAPWAERMIDDPPPAKKASRPPLPPVAEPTPPLTAEPSPTPPPEPVTLAEPPLPEVSLEPEPEPIEHAEPPFEPVVAAAPLPPVPVEFGPESETEVQTPLVINQVQSPIEPADEEYLPHDNMPLLPRGGAIFEDIPAKAVVLQELAPALQNGALVVRRPNAVGIVLVKDSELWERFCFHESTEPRYGDAAMAEIRLWLDATVSAFRLKRDVVEMAPALLRGDVIYSDLRLGWTNWKEFTADIGSRQGTHVVELQTARGRGVACFVDGQQVATFTSDHPEFGDPSLLDELAATGRGTISVRSQPAEKITVSAEPTGPIQVEAEPPSEPAAEPSTFDADNLRALGPGSNGGNGSNADTEAVENPFGPIFGGDGGASASPAPLDISVASILPQLKEIAQDRLQRSSSRVEAMLDDAAEADKPLEAVLAEIRGLVIRGVMQSTLDTVVDEMLAAASSLASA